MQDEAVIDAAQPLTRQLGPDDVLVNIEVTLHDDLPGQESPSAVRRFEETIRKTQPAIERM